MAKRETNMLRAPRASDSPNTGIQQDFLTSVDDNEYLTRFPVERLR